MWGILIFFNFFQINRLQILKGVVEFIYRVNTLS